MYIHMLAIVIIVYTYVYVLGYLDKLLKIHYDVLSF